MKKEKVAILGASKDPSRYAYKAFQMLREYGHEPLPVTPKFDQLEGVPAVARLSDLKTPIDTLTMYVGPAISSKLLDEVLALKPGRVIFNPGSENPELIAALEKAGIPVVEGCTLVMLRTRQF
ncbi:MAG: CoA-binding protein [Bdellovibrionaceae bacterium]|nr:CoA-binding protein [Pseudobdellovibrionaceae bacterium]